MFSDYDVFIKTAAKYCVALLNVSVVKIVLYTALTTRANSSGQVSKVK